MLFNRRRVATFALVAEEFVALASAWVKFLITGNGSDVGWNGDERKVRVKDLTTKSNQWQHA